MASTHLHIADMRVAIAQGIVPGSFRKNRTVFEFPTLSYAGRKGGQFLWTIRVRLIRLQSRKSGKYIPISVLYLDGQPLKNHIAEVTVEASKEGGKIRKAEPTYIYSGKNLGKKNATNILTQALRDALGSYNKQRKKVASILTPNKLEPSHLLLEDPMPPPMLLKDLGESPDTQLTPTDFTLGVTAQRKLNGVHFVAFLKSDGQTVVRYSRTSKEYPGQDHLETELRLFLRNAPPLQPGKYGLSYTANTEEEQMLFEAYGINSRPSVTAYKKQFPPNYTRVYLAGELYLHGKSLNWISGQARKSNDNASLEFHIFDVFFPHAKLAGHDMISRDRQSYLSAIFDCAEKKKLSIPHLKRVENFPVRSIDELKNLMHRFVHEQYEGAVARRDHGIYKYSYNNYHSGEVLKVKPIFTDEFPVVGFTQGRGKDLGAIIWICEVDKPIDPKDKTFSVVPKDYSYTTRKALFRCLQEKVKVGGIWQTRFDRDVKNLPLTIEYRERSSKTGKPLQAKALAFRTYEEGTTHDPIKKLFEECKILS